MGNILLHLYSLLGQTSFIKMDRGYISKGKYCLEDEYIIGLYQRFVNYLQQCVLIPSRGRM